MKTIYILWLRQIKRYTRSKSRMIGSLAQPILFLVALGFGFGPIYERAGGGNYIQFLTPGIISMTLLFSSVFFGIETIWDRQFGFLKETLVAPVSRFKIMIGRTLGGATISCFQGLMVFLISLIAGFKPQFIMLPYAILVMILITTTFTALGTAIASRMEDMHGFQLIMNFLIMPLFFLSGALFPINGLPNWISIVSYFNPLTYGVNALRNILTLGDLYSAIPAVFVLCIFAAVFLSIGSYLFSKIQI